MSKKVIVLSAPSGAGKTTVAKHLLAVFPQMCFSVSATTRAQRPGEVHGKDYFFLTKEQFRDAIERNDLVEYEEIYGNYYGTLRSEVEEQIANGAKVVFDVDVKGALSLRAAFGADALLIFIAPPSLEVLEERLQSRKTETSDQIAKRMARAQMEMANKDRFDVVIVNNVLATALLEAEAAVRTFVVL